MAAAAVPGGMRRVHARLLRWRKLRKARAPIPDSLWAAAAELAREHGVFRTAKVLGLEYGKLKRLAAAAKPVSRKLARSAATASLAPSAFVELLAPGTGGASECFIELEGPHGKMRVRWKGATGTDLAGLSRALWESS